MAIQLDNVTKSFRSWGRGRRPLYRELIMLLSMGKRDRSATAVLDEVNLEIPDGSRVAVIGKNGTGKSTLLRLIAGIYKQNAGEVRVDGRVCCFLEPGAGAAPTLPVKDNVFLYASLAGLTRDETEAGLERILEFCSLEEHRYTWVEHLSFGMQQRLFLSILLEVMRARKAEVFLFDEFLMGTDRSFRERVQQALIELPSPDQIVLHASHDMELMRRTCSSAILVKKGGIAHFGLAEEALEMYDQD